MGAFFTNLHARAAAAETIVEALRSAGALPAYITGKDQAWVGVYPEVTESQDQRLLARIAQALSTGAGTIVYASLVHDSDVWDFTVHDRGKLLDHYCSNPGISPATSAGPRAARSRPSCPSARPARAPASSKISSSAT